MKISVKEQSMSMAKTATINPEDNTAFIRGVLANENCEVQIISDNEDIVYVKADATDLSQITQNIITPEDTGSIELYWKKYSNYAHPNKWNRIKNIIDQNRSKGFFINYDSWQQIIGTPTTTPSILGGYYQCLLPDGSICATSFEGSYAGDIYGYLTEYDSYGEVYDPSTSFTYALPAIRTPILLPNGKIFLLSKANTSTSNARGIFSDPYTSNIELLDLPNGRLPIGATMLPNNKLFVLSTTVDTYIAYIIDPISKVIETSEFLSGIPVDLASFKEVALLPDVEESGLINCVVAWPQETIGDRLLFIDYTDLNNYRYEMIDYRGAVGTITANDKLVMPPFLTTDKPILYDLKTLTHKTIGYAYSTNMQQRRCLGSQLLPDGRVLLLPGDNDDTFHIVDPYDETMYPLGSTIGAWDKFQSARLLPTGEIYLSSQNYMGGTAAGKLQGLKPAVLYASNGNYGVVPDMDLCLSSYLNVGF